MGTYKSNNTEQSHTIELPGKLTENETGKGLEVICCYEEEKVCLTPFQAAHVFFKGGRNFKPVFVKKQKSKLCLPCGKVVISCAFLFIKQSLVTFSNEESYLPYEYTGGGGIISWYSSK